MKVQCTGKVTKRSQRKATNGKVYYSIVLEECGAKFPRPFEFTSEDASLFGPSDGFAAVGQVVTATGFANGYAKEFVDKEGKKRTMYGVRFRLTDLANGCDGSAPEAPASGSSAEDGQLDVDDVI